MMAEILALLVEMLKARYKQAPPFHIKKVSVASEYQAATRLAVDDVPCIIVMPNGEPQDELGPFANTTTRYFSFIIRMIARSISPQKYREQGNAYNIYALSDDIRLALSEKKDLGLLSADGKYVRLDTNKPISDLDTMFGDQNGHWNARDLSIQYKLMETWTGERNNQRTLRTPTLATSVAELQSAF